MKIMQFFIILFLSTSLINNANAQNIGVRICEYIAADDKTRLRSFLRQEKLKIRSIFDDLQCNNMNILVFAADRKALDSGKLIIGKISSQVAADNLEAVTALSPELSAEIKDRIK